MVKNRSHRLIPKKELSFGDKNESSLVFFFLDQADHRRADPCRGAFHFGHLRPPTGRRSGRCPTFFTGGGEFPRQFTVVRYLSFPSILYFDSSLVGESDRVFPEPLRIVVAPI